MSTPVLGAVTLTALIVGYKILKKGGLGTFWTVASAQRPVDM